MVAWGALPALVASQALKTPLKVGVPFHACDRNVCLGDLWLHLFPEYVACMCFMHASNDI